jgi:hypothetical protein
MGNCQQTQTQTQSKNRGEEDDDDADVKRDSNNHFTPPSNTLTSLKADKTSGYSFSIPKNACFNGSSGESCIISSSGDIEFGDTRKFVPVDSTRCLLTHKGKTEAILIRNDHTQTIQICSFTPPGNEIGNGHPLFEWGVIGKSNNNRTRCTGYTMTTPINNGSNYSVRGVLVASSTSSQQQISNVHNNNNNNNNKMVVTTLNSNGENKTCATFFEGMENDTWECHTMSGIDPVMMVCFIVALDTLRTMNKQRSGSIINFGSVTHRRMILSRGGSRTSSRTSRTNSVRTSSRTASLLTSNTSTLNNSSGRSAFGKMLEKSSSSKRNSIGSCSGASCLQQQEMPRRTSFINNARAA